MKQRFADHPEYLVLLVALVVAVVQLYYSNFDNLSAWRGGGFGMYTEPHPVHYRTAFVCYDYDEDDFDSEPCLRLYPVDVQVIEDDVKAGYLKASSIVRSRITFPSLINDKELVEQLRIIGANRGQKVLSVGDCVQLMVFEIGLSGNGHFLQNNLIHQKKICLRE